MTIPARSMRIAGRSLLAGLLAGSLVVLAGCGGGNSNSSSISLSGTITGLTADGLVLSSGANSVAIAANATTFTFPSRFLIGSAFVVAPSALPATLTCTVANGVGIAPAGDITNIAVTCVPKSNLGGTITGLRSSGLILANGSDVVRPAAGAQSFVFPTKVGQGFSYGVTVLQQPAPQVCAVVANNSGIMGPTDLNNVQVACQ